MLHRHRAGRGINVLVIAHVPELGLTTRNGSNNGSAGGPLFNAADRVYEFSSR